MTDNLTQESTDLRAQLIAALESCACPHCTINAWGDHLTIGACTRSGQCGCDNGDLIKLSQGIKS